MVDHLRAIAVLMNLGGDASFDLGEGRGEEEDIITSLTGRHLFFFSEMQYRCRMLLAKHVLHVQQKMWLKTPEVLHLLLSGERMRAVLTTDH